MSQFEGKFVWYELMTSDTASAEEFYKYVTGWSAVDSGVPGMAYTLFQNAGRPVAGLMMVPDDAAAMGAKPGWIGYIGAADVDAKAAEITSEGGTLYRAPADIPNTGRFAVMADPHGAVFCLFHPNGEMPPAPPIDSQGEFVWHELHAGDGPAAFDFYAKLFGWRKGEAMDMGGMGVYQLYGKDEADFGGIMTKEAQSPMPYWLYYVSVSDIEAAGGRIAEKGGTIVHGPTEVPGNVFIINALDPQGALFAVVGPKV